jgi:hypothetical protein
VRGNGKWAGLSSSFGQSLIAMINEMGLCYSNVGVENLSAAADSVLLHTYEQLATT